MTAAACTLKIADLNRIGELHSQIEGILDCIAIASQAEPAGDAIPCAVWAATTLLEQLTAIVYATAIAGEVDA